MLKQLAAILLIGILFFNWYGYQLLTAYWQQQSDNKLEARLDKHEYTDDQLVSIKIPLTTLAYYNNSSSFERVNGQVEIKGIHYNYVKRRIYGDSLELLCIPNTAAMNLQKAKNEFFRQVNDLQQQNQGKKNTAASKDLSRDYTPTTMDITVPAALAMLKTTAGVFLSPDLPCRYSPTAEMPPDQAPVLS